MKQYHSTQYLYNIEPIEIADLPYKEALEKKLKKSKALIKTLHTPEYYERDEERIREVFDAIELTEYLLKELKNES